MIQKVLKIKLFCILLVIIMFLLKKFLILTKIKQQNFVLT